jgi:Tfp pilus assembly protein PilO
LRNDTTAGATSGDARTGVRARFDSFRTARRRGALGLPEVLALAAAAVLLFLAVLAYLFLLVPQRSRLQNLETERNDLQRLIQSQQQSLGGQQNTQQRVSEILTSLNSFQIEHLGQSSGAGNIIEELNHLILKNNLRISGGISYTQLQEAAPGAPAGQTQRRTSGEDTQARVVQSIFPGIGVTLTVEGTYASLRHFIRDIEADRQFVVVNTVELEGVSDSSAASALSAIANEPAQSSPLTPRSAPAPARPVNPEGAPAPGAQAVVPPTAPTRGALVSLRLDMAAYFRRAGTASE